MLSKGVEIGNIESLKMGGDGLVDSHLQFPNHTIFSLSNGLNKFKTVFLPQVEPVSSLHINLAKSSLLGSTWILVF